MWWNRPMPVFRVQFRGPGSDDRETIATAAGAEWEGTRGFPGEPYRHFFLIEHDSPENAIDTLRAAVKPHHKAEDFSADQVTLPPGWKGLNREGVDWDDVGTRCHLTGVQREALHSLLDDAEPTWIVVKHSQIGDRPTVETVLSGLEQRGLVWHVREDSYNPDSETELEDWWALTDRGWAILGLIKRPWYNHGQQPPNQEPGS
jgi:hypothetical protein